MRPFTWTLGVGLALVVAVNTLAAWDHHHQEVGLRAAAANVHPGLTVRFEGSIDERRFQEARLSVIPAPRLVAFGSSRVREMSRDVIGAGPEEFYNLGMSAATIEDYIALWSLLRRAGKIPEVAVFSIDAWVFNRDREDVRWISLANEVTDFLDAAGGAPGKLWLLEREMTYGWAQAKELVSYTVLMSSLRRLERRLAGRPRRGDDLLETLRRDVVPESAIDPRHGIRADGSVVRAATGNERTAREIREEAVRYGGATGYDLKRFRWDPERARRLELLWRDVRSRGVTILAYMPPYHPAVWTLLREDAVSAGALDESTSFLRGLADRIGVRFIDVSDPALVPCDERDFHDGHHANAQCLARIWRRLSG